jgi:hypothetical protein
MSVNGHSPTTHREAEEIAELQAEIVELRTQLQREDDHASASNPIAKQDADDGDYWHQPPPGENGNPVWVDARVALY